MRLGFITFAVAMGFGRTSIVAQQPCHWPCFHGPERTNISPESGLQEKWPDGGPSLLWSAGGLGKGYASVSIADGLIFTSGKTGQRTFVYAFDMDGHLVWKAPNGQSWETDRQWARSYDGARSTPTWDDGVVYHLGELGRLAAFDARSGTERWAVELRERYEAEIPEYGYSESVYIEDDRLFVCPAGEEAYMVCLDKITGREIWRNDQIPGHVGFSSLMPFEYGGYSQLAGMSSSTVFGVDATTGKLLWSLPFANSRDNNVADPIFTDGAVIVSSGYGRGTMKFRLLEDGGRFDTEILWDTELMDNHHGGVILREGYLYGAGHNNRGWFCLDAATGEQQWEAPGKGSLTLADGMLYCLDERGTVTLVKADPEAYRETGRFEVPEGGTGMHWAHPVVCGGRLYIRYDDRLFVFDVSENP